MSYTYRHLVLLPRAYRIHAPLLNKFHPTCISSFNPLTRISPSNASLASIKSINYIILSQVEDDIEKVKNASSQSELVDNFRLFGKNTSELVNRAAKRQGELKDPRLRDDLASARAVLKKNSMMLLTASKVCLAIFGISTNYLILDSFIVLCFDFFLVIP